MKQILIFTCLIALSIASTIDLVTIVRDFTAATHPDFGTYGGSYTGLVENTLSVDGKPIYRSGPVITSSASFDQWYRDTEGINIRFTKPMTLTEDSTRPGIFVYSNNNYFPVDNEGYGNTNNGHNFHFTTEIRSMFTYRGGETFSFNGDDDVWVFINRRLAVDIGGVHGPQGGSVNLDASAAALGITIGNDYEFVIFQAERMCCGSSFTMETSIQLVSVDPEEPTPGRPAYVCEVMFPDFCAGFPVPSGVPSRQAATCPSDPVLHLGGSAYSMDNFNAISFDSFYAASGDVEGRTAIRNNLNLPLGQYSFGYELRTGGPAAIDHSLPFALVVGGDANWNGGAVLPDGSNFPYAGAREDIYVGGACAGCLDADFDNAQAYYTLLQAAFDGVADNAVLTYQDSGLHLTCSSLSASGYSVHIDGASFSAATWWTVNTATCNPDVQLVINIGGNGQVKFAGAHLPSFKNERVLYNVLGSGRTIRIETEVAGSILGPNHQYNQPGMGVVKGHVIVGNIVEALQINRLNCVRPAPPPTPTDEVCPEWETQCDGLNFPMAGEVHSFRDFAVVSFGSFVADTGDVEGRLAVRDDVTLGAGYTIGFELRTQNNQPDNSLPYSLIVGGDLCWRSGSLHPDGTGIPYAGDNEDAFVGGSVCGSTADYLLAEATGSCGTNVGCLDSYFDAARTCYEGYQNTLASLSDNVAQSVEWSALKLTCSDSDADRYVVSITPATMSQYTYITTDNCNFQASWVVNVRGTGDVFFRGDSFPGVPAGIVFNVLGSGRVIDVTGTAVTGHILAPNNILHQTGGVIIGKVVVADVTFSLQINKHSCPNPGEVPISVPVVEDVPALSSSMTVASLALVSGDSFTVGPTVHTITASTADRVIYFTPETTQAVSAGSVITVKASGITSRQPGMDEVPSSSSSIVSVSIALLVAMLAMF